MLMYTYMRYFNLHERRKVPTSFVFEWNMNENIL